MNPKVLLYVQHLWGVGHVYRATRIAHGMARAGMEVHLVWGGTRLPGFNFGGLNAHFLTPVRTSDASFSQLLHGDGSVFSDVDKDRRRDQLLALAAEIRPDIVITEAFPFGRRQMRFELLPLLEFLSSLDRRPLIAASIRDIMQEDRKPARVSESCELMERYFDLVLVHGDEKLIAIEETLQGIEDFKDKIRYTGLVTPEPSSGEMVEDPVNVLVSVGGGAFGRELLMTAIEAMPLCNKFPSGWKITTGTEISDESFEEIKKRAPDGMTVVRHIRDMVAQLQASKVSVSHSGYNTVGDLLQAGCKAVLYPYTGGRETEQLRRAQMMDRLGLAKLLAPQSLSTLSLASAVDQIAESPIVKAKLDTDGASQTARILFSELGHTLN
ncbi:MAG: glycosyltransferase [Pseudomonadota bacterium]